jgi:hypothetical protein
MPHISIIIKRCSDKVPALPEVDNKNYIEELQLDKMVILEKGMQSGEPSIMFKAVDLHGGVYLIQTSAIVLTTCVDALRGARLHWEQNPE